MARENKTKKHLNGPDLFDWARERELLTNPAVRKIARASCHSPSVSALLVELMGLGGRRDD